MLLSKPVADAVETSEDVKLGLSVVPDTEALEDCEAVLKVNSNNYQSGVLVEKIQEGINHFSDKKPEIQTIKKTPINQVKQDNLVKITE